MIVGNWFVLTYLLRLMAERGIPSRFAFKGGTCPRGMFIGSGGASRPIWISRGSKTMTTKTWSSP